MGTTESFESRVLLTRDAEIATLTLSRGVRLNALDLASGRALLGAATALREDPDVRVVVIQANGDGFCGGGDIAEMNAAPDRKSYLRELTELINEALVVLADLPAIILTAVHGAVAGGGLGLMLAGDITIAEEGAVFAPGYRGLGVTPDCGASTRLPAAVGARRALWFFLAASRIDTVTAREWGLVEEVVPVGQLGARVSELANALTAIEPEALAQTRRLIRHAQNGTFSDRLDDEQNSISTLGGTAAAGALIARFAARSRGA